jgi:FKBP-type peptidyl-prolyl cis-trans isomerase FkpA
MERKYMNKIIVAVFIALLAVPAFAASAPKTEDQKTLYAIGVVVAKQLDIFNLSPEELKFVVQGITDSTTGKKLVAESDPYQNQINILAQSRMKVSAEKQKTKSKAFLENAAKEKGAQKLASGLIYTSITEGSGTQPKATDKVRVHYTGTFIDGKVFDSSVKRGQPAEFPLNQVIKCWTEGVSMMKAGGKAKLVCPSDIAYGDAGRPPSIPGGATLVFEVELLDVLPADAQK